MIDYTKDNQNYALYDFNDGIKGCGRARIMSYKVNFAPENLKIHFFNIPLPLDPQEIPQWVKDHKGISMIVPSRSAHLPVPSFGGMGATGLIFQWEDRLLSFFEQAYYRDPSCSLGIDLIDNWIDVRGNRSMITINTDKVAFCHRNSIISLKMFNPFPNSELHLYDTPNPDSTRFSVFVGTPNPNKPIEIPAIGMNMVPKPANTTNYEYYTTYYQPTWESIRFTVSYIVYVFPKLFDLDPL